MNEKTSSFHEYYEKYYEIVEDENRGEMCINIPMIFAFFTFFIAIFTLVIAMFIKSTACLSQEEFEQKNRPIGATVCETK